MARYRTVAHRSRFQPAPVKGSRFLASVGPAHTEAQAAAFVSEVEAEYRDATHHCWAWRLHDGRFRSSDAGEPGGSAGRPILAQIEGRGLSDVVVVVSRWFGGTKLGVGGLIRAYGGAAGMALDRARVVEVDETTPLVVEHAYDDTGSVEAVVRAEGLDVLSADYGEVVRLTLSVPLDGLDRVRRLLCDRTSGRVRFVPREGPG